MIGLVRSAHVVTNRERRLVMVCTALGPGGGVREQILALAGSLRRRGWSVTVVSLLPVEQRFPELEELGVVFTDLGMRRGIPDPRAVTRLGRILSHVEPDVVHSHQVHANLLARVTRLLAPVSALVSTIHNENEGGRWRYVAYRVTDRLSNVTTAVSQVAGDGASARGAVGRRGVVVVPNGIETSRHQPDALVRATKRKELGVEGHFVWLAAGRLTAAKAYHNMLDAVGTLHREDPRPILLIAGDGPLGGELEKRVQADGLGASVRLLGLRGDVRELMQAADAFVLSSAWEGLPMVLLEAASVGLPIVATDVGGTREVVLHGASGYMVPPGNGEALAEAMSAVMSLPAAGRRQMGEAGRSHVQRAFELEQVVDRWERIYSDLVTHSTKGTETR